MAAQHCCSALFGMWLLLLLPTVSAWDLSLLLDARVTHVTLQGPRALLSVPRIDLAQPFTLVEAPWPERSKHLPIRSFPARETQKIGDCRAPQSVVCTDSDGLTLVVLDTGLENLCPPKIMVYDYIRGKKMFSIHLPSVRGTRLRTLVMDSGRAYAGQPAASHLLICDLASHRCWQVALRPPPEPGAHNPSSTLLAISGSSLYLASDRHDTLFRANLTSLRSSEPSITSGAEQHQSIQVSLEGGLLGRPSALLADKRDGLVYCAPQHYACARWDTKLPLAAESHEIILQSGVLLSDVQSLFLDAQRQIWALLPTKTATTYLQCLRIRNPNFNSF